MSTTETDAVIAAEVETPWDYYEFFLARDQLAISSLSYRTLKAKHLLHPCVEMMILDKHRPKDVAQLALEWPHVSTSDDARIGYTRNAVDLENDRQLVTSVGKYLARHWPHVPDHIRRDVQATFVPDVRKIVRTLPEMVQAVEDGPRSCMASAHGSIRFTAAHKEAMRLWFQEPDVHSAPDWTKHPYSAYRPDLGWSMAVRLAAQPDKTLRIDGRALILSRANEKPVFVRTYARNKADPVNGWSETDFMLQAWLTRQGYEKVDYWPDGALLWTPPIREGATDICAPYIDGGQRQLTLAPDAGEHLARIEHGAQLVGSYWCEETSGIVRAKSARSASGRQSVEDFADENDYDVEDCRACDDCDEPMHCDDATTVGRDEGSQVCEGCIDNYTYVRGSCRWGNYREYYVPNDYAASMNYNYSVDVDNLPDDVVCLVNGDYAERDDCVYIDSVNEYYLADDEDICSDIHGDWQLRDDCVSLEDRDGYLLRDDAYQAETDDGMWFSTEEACDAFDAEARAQEAELAKETEVT